MSFPHSNKQLFRKLKINEKKFWKLGSDVRNTKHPPKLRPTVYGHLFSRTRLPRGNIKRWNIGPGIFIPILRLFWPRTDLSPPKNDMTVFALNRGEKATAECKYDGFCWKLNWLEWVCKCKYQFHRSRKNIMKYKKYWNI